MFWWVSQKKQLATISDLKEQVRQQAQEQEAARLGLTSRIDLLARELKKLPIDAALEAVGHDIAGSKKSD
jgi:hypothetical protein